MALRFEGGGQFVADFKGLGDEAPGKDEFERLESLLAADQTADFGVDHLGDARVVFGRGKVGNREALGLECLDRRDNERAEILLVLADDQTLLDEARLEQLGLDGDGFDVLAAEENDGFLRAAEDFQTIIEGDHADVPRVHPAVPEDLGGGPGILVVALHDLRAFGLDLAFATPTAPTGEARGIDHLAVRRIHDADFSARPKRTDRADDQLAPGPHREHGRGLGHAVALQHGDADVIEKFVDVRRQGASAGNRAAEFSPDHTAQLFQHEGIEDFVG